MTDAATTTEDQDKYLPTEPTPEDFITGVVGDQGVPFFQTESLVHYGLGHTDKALFAETINAYHAYATGEPLSEDEQMKESDVQHVYAHCFRNGRGEFRVEPIDKGSREGATAVTMALN